MPEVQVVLDRNRVPTAYSILDDLLEWNRARRREAAELRAALRRPEHAEP